MEVLKLRSITKKKSYTDFVALFFALVILFGVGIFALILYNAYNDNIKDNLSDALTSSTPQDADANVTKILEDTGSGIGKLNPLFPLLLVGVIGYVLMLALLSRSHPAFFFIGLLVLAIALIIAVTFSNVYEGIAETTAFASTDAEFTVIGFIMDNLPVFIFLIFIGISIVLYALRKGPTPGGNY